jgi:PTH1 family peptidyl-tRNA hydrolase
MPKKFLWKNTLTVVDDIAIPLDGLRLRPVGSDGGHNGLKDIQLMLGTDKYPKLRFGIGNNYPKGMQADFVLMKWLPEELKLVWNKIEYCTELIEQFSVLGIEKNNECREWEKIYCCRISVQQLIAGLITT